MKTEYDLKKMKIKRRGILPILRTKTGDLSKVRITISLDKDIINYFKSEAKQPGTLPYQTQINLALRSIINRVQGSVDDVAEIKTILLHDKDFIKQVARCIGKK